MDRFSVNWLDDALIEIAGCAARSSDARKVVAAVGQANRILAEDGANNARFLSEDLWCRDFEPLRVFFYCDNSKFEVEVAMVWLLD